MPGRFDYILFILTAFLILFLTGCRGTSGQNSLLGGDERESIPSVPDEYSGYANPFTGDADAIAQGEILYQANCSSCHGSTGEGDGPASGGIDPKPGNIATRQANLSDSYLFWRISEGGLMEPFNSIMPGWKGILSAEKIWQVITYLRTMVVL